MYKRQGLVNGQCGGAKNGKCEIDPKKDCAWEKIYQRLEKQGRTKEFLDQPVQLRDYSKVNVDAIKQYVAEARAKRYEGFTAQAVTQQIIAGDGSTIVNVYYERNEYTITFYLDDVIYTCGKQHWHNRNCPRITQLTITAKHGANISDQWPKVDGSSSWRTTENGSTYQSNIDVMPVGGGSYYGPNKDWGSETAYYYVEVLPGETGTTYHGVTYKEHHRDVSPGTGSVSYTHLRAHET